MVHYWLPEPPNEHSCDEIQASDDIIIPGTDTSDTEDDDNIYNGYEPLPLGPGEAENSSSSDESDSENINNTPSSSSLPPIVPIDRTLVREVWSSSTPPCTDIEMDPAKANEVKMAMANFTLPTSSIPDWAVNIPEEQWKEQLINRIQSLQESRTKK